MRLFNSNRKESCISNVFNKKKIIEEILEKKDSDCPGWKFFRIKKYELLIVDNPPSKQFDTLDCDFIAIFTDVINKEIRLKSNPFSEYKRTVESVYQIVREIYITEEVIDFQCNESYKAITAASAKELFIKLKNEVQNE